MADGLISSKSPHIYYSIDVHMYCNPGQSAVDAAARRVHWSGGSRSSERTRRLQVCPPHRAALCVVARQFSLVKRHPQRSNHPRIQGMSQVRWALRWSERAGVQTAGGIL